jgi:L-rhamnose mutarotase
MQQRIAFKMNLTVGCADEYRKRHNEIWPELAALLKKSGVADYSIFLDEQTNILFAVLKVEDPAILNLLSQEKIMQKWWQYMSDITESNTDYSPVITPLVEVFHLL